MVIVMEHTASEEQFQKVIETLVEEGYDVHRSSGVDYTVLGAVGSPRRPIDPRLIEVLPGVREVVRISEPYKLAGRTFKAEDTVVDLAGVPVGGAEVIAMAGPCSVESAEQVGAVAKTVAASGAHVGDIEDHVTARLTADAHLEAVKPPSAALAPVVHLGIGDTDDAIGRRALTQLRVTLLIVDDVVAEDLGQQPSGGQHLGIITLLVGSQLQDRLSILNQLLELRRPLLGI